MHLTVFGQQAVSGWSRVLAGVVDACKLHQGASLTRCEGLREEEEGTLAARGWLQAWIVHVVSV